MKLLPLLNRLMIVLVLLSGILGCSKKEENPPADKETAVETTAPATNAESPRSFEKPVPPGLTETASVAASPDMEAFLSRAVRMRAISKSDEIAGYFNTWSDTTRADQRRPLDVCFEVDVEGNFKQDHTWRGTTNRAFLNELCQENGLVWTITKPNTIRITR